MVFVRFDQLVLILCILTVALPSNGFALNGQSLNPGQLARHAISKAGEAGSAKHPMSLSWQDHAWLATYQANPLSSASTVQIFQDQAIFGDEESGYTQLGNREIARYSTKAAFDAYRRPRVIPMLREFRGYLKGAFMANQYVLQDAYKCTESLEILMGPDCKDDFYEFFENRLIPGYMRARLLAALQESGRWLSYEAHLTETPSVLSNIRAKMNPDRTNHPFYYYSDIGPNDMQDELEVEDLQPLSAEEIVQALVRFKQDGLHHRADRDYEEEVREAVERRVEHSPHIGQEPELLRRVTEQYENFIGGQIDQYVHNQRADIDRPAYDQEYQDLLHDFPSIAFLQMPIDPNPGDNSRAYVKDLLCAEGELAADRALLWEEDTVDAMFGGICKSDVVPNDWSMRYLAGRNRYLSDIESFLGEIRKAVEVQLVYGEQIITAPYEHDEDDFDDMIWLLSYNQAFEYFVADTAPPEGLSNHESYMNEAYGHQGRERDRPHQFAFSTNARERHFEMYEYLKSSYESKVFWRDMRNIGAAVGLGVACALILGRLKPATWAVSTGARALGWKRFAAAASCYLIPGAMVNLWFLDLANNRYMQNFRSFVSSAGTLEANGDLPEDLHSPEGRVQSRLLTSLDKVVEHDQALAWEYAFFLIGTGTIDTIRLILRGL
ncbi:MAG: hypothetical protein HRT45_08635 [Bdellovibrionales bacterium]|nr:hypothetical protein [Bdellovibrionales bacterium]